MKLLLCGFIIILLYPVYCKKGDEPYEFGDRSDWIDPSDMLNYDASAQRMKKPMKQRRSSSADEIGTNQHVQFDGAAVRESIAKLYDQMTQTLPENKDAFVQTIKDYMSEYACGNNKVENGEQSNLQKCQTELQDLRLELQSLRSEERSTPSSLEKTYFKQYIRTLLKHYSRTVFEGAFLLYNTEILLNSDDLLILERFANTEYGNVQDAHEVLNRMIQHVELVEAGDIDDWRSNVSEHYKEYIILTLQIVAILTLSSVAITLQVRLHLSWKQLLVKILVLLFLISIPWNWWHMYKIAVAKRQAEAAKDVPLECRPEKQTASQSFWTALRNTFTLNTDKCAEYYEKMLVDPAYEVAPTQTTCKLGSSCLNQTHEMARTTTTTNITSPQALAVTVTKFVVEPLEHIGHAVGKLIHGTLQELPIQIWPFALAFICMMSLFILTLIFGYRIKLFYLFGIEPGKHTPRASIKDEEQQKQLQNRIQDLTCQIERLTLTQSGQAALAGETSGPPVVSLFPAELPPTPRRVGSETAGFISGTPRRAIENASSTLEQTTPRRGAGSSAETNEMVPKPILPSSGVLHIDQDAATDPDEKNSNTVDHINILAKPLATNRVEFTKPEQPDSIASDSIEQNASQDLSAVKSSTNHIETHQVDVALDLTLDKAKGDGKLLAPTLENLGAGDSCEDDK